MKLNVSGVSLCVIASLVAALATNRVQAATIAITEWAYNANGGEYVEFTNVSGAPIDMTDWSQDDSNRTPGKHAFGATFGIVQPGESVILTEIAAATFRTEWGLGASVKIWAGPAGTGYSNDNLSRSDEINLYDKDNNLVDRLTFNDQASLGPRTQNVGGNIPLASLGLNSPQDAVLSFIGDTYLSHTNTVGDIGNPGLYTPYPVPEPATITLVAVAALALATRRLTARKLPPCQ